MLQSHVNNFLFTCYWLQTSSHHTTSVSFS
uniref:Uncharacterized protein n=1 Tax=Rhizophora mucronata TaxID=61149 RepID=A0A2P2MZ28_RHIMU